MLKMTFLDWSPIFNDNRHLTEQKQKQCIKVKVNEREMHVLIERDKTRIITVYNFRIYNDRLVCAIFISTQNRSTRYSKSSLEKMN